LKATVPTTSLRRILALGGTAAGETLLLTGTPSAWHGLAEPPPGSLPADRAASVLTGALVLAGMLACTYWCLLLVVTAAGHVGWAPPVPMAPPGWRAAVAACLGLAVAAGTATAAGAGPGGPRLDGLPLPDRPLGRAASTPVTAVVTVRPGDTLWGLAAAALPATASDAAVDRTWRRWYAANQHTVGPDPDLLLPGQRLVPPSSAERTPR
jgi:nucleoid-associated protein YgaU